MNQENATEFSELVQKSTNIVVIQADNPDGDSLGSALALEEILSDMDKNVSLYCGVDIPDYLKHLDGWSRVSSEIPKNIDLSIIVDTSALTLLEKLDKSSDRILVAAHPVVVLDHHTDVVCDIPYASLVINDAPSVATGELLYEIASTLQWDVNLQAKTHIVSSILSDSLGLSSEGTTPRTYRVIADLIEAGVNRPKLEEARRAHTKMPMPILRYKARLIDRVEFHNDNTLAVIVIPDQEITEFSPLYNPAPLIQSDVLQTENVLVAIVLKSYRDGRITGSFRANHGGHIGQDFASHFGGGGHVYASGFKVTDGRGINEIKQECIALASELLNTLNNQS